ncbi:class I SAM-dependent methyltransferase [Nocardia sp. NPDC051321]|uniref:class I SAM-dependent methyltransferase n=1 Tax=Nocardia sp. NPDC051321 TaxID=3364323 RepID=UPI0037B5F981
MQQGQPSRTALGAARARAFHQTEDAPHIFADPLAVTIAGAATAAVASTERPDDDGIPAEARLFLAMRHRFAEDALAKAAGGIRQVVVLGAGLDTFAYRNPYPDLTVFEVDHPATQAWKRDRLADAGIAVPAELRFVPVDFETGTLAEGLAAVGFSRTEPAFFLWLGVVQYLTPDAVEATLRYIVEHGAAAQVVFDYSEPPSALPAPHQPMVEALAQVMERLGEPWLSLFTVDDITAKLQTIGFDEIEDLDWRQMIARYAPDSPAADLVGGHVLRAAHTGHVEVLAP